MWPRAPLKDLMWWERVRPSWDDRLPRRTDMIEVVVRRQWLVARRMLEASKFSVQGEALPQKSVLVNLSSGDIPTGFYRVDSRQLRFARFDASLNFIGLAPSAPNWND